MFEDDPKQAPKFLFQFPLYWILLVVLFVLGLTLFDVLDGLVDVERESLQTNRLMIISLVSLLIMLIAGNYLTRAFDTTFDERYLNENEKPSPYCIIHSSGFFFVLRKMMRPLGYGYWNCAIAAVIAGFSAGSSGLISATEKMKELGVPTDTSDEWKELASWEQISINNSIQGALWFGFVFALFTGVGLYLWVRNNHTKKERAEAKIMRRRSHRLRLQLHFFQSHFGDRIRTLVGGGSEEISEALERPLEVPEMSEGKVLAESSFETKTIDIQELVPSLLLGGATQALIAIWQDSAKDIYRSEEFLNSAVQTLNACERWPYSDTAVHPLVVLTRILESTPEENSVDWSPLSLIADTEVAMVWMAEKLFARFGEQIPGALLIVFARCYEVEEIGAMPLIEKLRNNSPNPFIRATATFMQRRKKLMKFGLS